MSHEPSPSPPATRKPSSPKRRRKPSGNWNADWEPFAQLDPAWTEKVIAMAIAPAVAGTLDRKTIELIGVALEASYPHIHASGVRRRIRRALEAGATRGEITSVLQLASLQGLQAICVGAPILFEELDAIKARADDPTRTAKEMP